uniref:BAR domain-containing protein n=1 Tax=Ornithorhynchus anatinus TaxID=9258 RepID=A0A6I8PEK2_ORNAN
LASPPALRSGERSTDAVVIGTGIGAAPWALRKYHRSISVSFSLRRAEKTEVLSEDLLQVEKRLELVKQVSHSTHKKLTACLQGQQGVEADKRSKKLPLTTLAQCLTEGSAILGDDTLLGKMLKLCGEAEDKLAQELIHFELQVERDVIEPLFMLAEVEIPNIQKQRKHLAKLVLDMDSSKTSPQAGSNFIFKTGPGLQLDLEGRCEDG